MNSEQLKQLSKQVEKVESCIYSAWVESMDGGNIITKESAFKLFEQYLRELNEMVERFHMDNENEVTSERVQP